MCVLISVLGKNTSILVFVYFWTDSFGAFSNNITKNSLDPSYWLIFMLQFSHLIVDVTDTVVN